MKNLLCLFLIYGFVKVKCNLKSVWYVRDFEYTSACDAHVRLKTNGTAIKIAKETTKDQ